MQESFNHTENIPFLKENFIHLHNLNSLFKVRLIDGSRHMQNTLYSTEHFKFLFRKVDRVY